MTPTAREDEASSLLSQLGLSRGVAKALIFLSKVDEATSPQIEKGTGLRQPEVSVAMQQLRDRAWVEKRDEKRAGKGRPVHCYRLTVRLADVIALIEREKRDEADANEKAIDRLRSISNGKVF